MAMLKKDSSKPKYSEMKLCGEAKGNGVRVWWYEEENGTYHIRYRIDLEDVDGKYVPGPKDYDIAIRGLSPIVYGENVAEEIFEVLSLGTLDRRRAIWGGWVKDIEDARKRIAEMEREEDR